MRVACVERVECWTIQGVLCLSLILAGGYADGVSAAEKTGAFALKGVAYMSCEDYRAARKQNGMQLGKYAGWMEGYMSAYNRFMPDTINIAPWQNTNTLLGLIAAFCEENPNAPYVTTVDRLIAELHPYRLKESSDVIQVQAGDHKGTVYREVVIQIQSRLRALGFLHLSESSGEYDTNTVEALKAYQRKVGSADTGFPDQTTLLKLFFK